MNNGHIDPHTIDKETLISYAQSLTTLKEKRSDIEISSLHSRSIANGIKWSDKNFLHSLAVSASPENILDNNIQKRDEEIAREQKAIEDRLERERQEKQKIAEKKRKAQEEANKPENKLKLVYQAYVDAKQCHKIRQGYAIMYINDSQMQMLKQYVRNIENHYKSVSTLDTDKIWKNASIEQQRRLNEDELLKYNDWTKWHCDTVLNGIIQHHDNLFANQAIAKDF